MNSNYGAYKKTIAWSFGLITLALVVGVVSMLIERPSQSQQVGFRGTGMGLVHNTARLAADASIHEAPAIHKAARVRPGGPIAGNSYKNVKVLTELSIGEFGRTMTAMSEWIAPKESCGYCHVDGDFASDAKYTKVVARRMLEMVRHVNTTWKPHTGETGVTCYTCHRGNPLPPQRWFKTPDPQSRASFRQRAADVTAAPLPGLAVLATDPLLDFLAKPMGSDAIRIIGTQVTVSGPRPSVQNAEKTYGLMVHIANSLGVNCTFCHNARAFADWPQSTPQRMTAWQGIQMVRDVNNQFMEPLGGVFPAVPVGRLGPTGDAAKVSCATCHLGNNKPLKGAQMARHYPALLTPYVVAAAPAASAPAAAASAPAEAASAPEGAASSPLELMVKAPAAPASAEPAAVRVAVAAVDKPLATASRLAAAPAVAPATVSAPAVAAASVPAAVPAAAAPVVAAAKAPAPVAVAAAEPPNCIDIGASGTKGGTRVAAAAALRQVSGSGRLGFFSAPDKGCEMLGTYIQPGDVVEASVDFSGYTAVRYQRTSSGVEVKGWVRTERLAAAAKAATPVAAAPAPAPVASAPVKVAAIAAPAPAPASAPVKTAAVAASAPIKVAAAPAPAPAVAPAASAPVRVAAAAGADSCRSGEALAVAGRQAVAPGAARRVVLGSGRLQFYSAPQSSCPQNGVFILPGEAVEAIEQVGDYTVVRYRNPRNGNEARGWVQSSRLALAPAPVKTDSTAKTAMAN